MKKIILLVLVVVFAFSGCEKDDICAANTATTPRLVLSFYDISNSTVLKNVTRLKVVGEGMTEGIIFNASATGESKYLTSGSTISIPLKTDEDTTTYSFTFNSGNANPDLIFVDNVTINYTRNTIYVSRACGYKTIFTLNPTNAIVHTAEPVSSETWIQYISVEKTNIENENETHLKIFF